VSPYRRVVESLVSTLLIDCGFEGNSPGVVTEVSAFVLDQQQRMPDFLRLAMTLLTWAFEFLPLLTTFRRFSSHSLERRREIFADWHCSRFRARRDFAAFYGGLAGFAWYSRSPVQAGDGE